ncbi:UNVERIFIED_ORG: hypothetical protein QE446_000476 [Rhizobium sp. SORGH_AS260]|nr:hypothetical protein [Rhizobium sp. SORGH_AS_0285]MDP9752619.1 hypothetical protein [Rhizobium sp. SORGH_AS_0260]MDR6079584.1 hypothetical protein [Agrobacterium sp. SORGH_AS_0440]
MTASDTGEGIGDELKQGIDVAADGARAADKGDGNHGHYQAILNGAGAVFIPAEIDK